MTTRYRVTYADPVGANSWDLSDFTTLEAARGVNVVGKMTITLPTHYDGDIFASDGRILLSREVDGLPPRLFGDAIWLVRSIRTEQQAANATRLTLDCVDGVDILRRRFIDYVAGSTGATKTGAADTVALAYVTENLGSGAITYRQLASTLFAISPVLGTAPTITKAAAYQTLLKTLQEIAADSALQGTYLAFDVVGSGSAPFEFRMYQGQRGIDRRSGGTYLAIGVPYGNLANAMLTEDYREEATFIAALGQGEGPARERATAQNAPRIAASPLGLIERMRDARHVGTTTALVDEANSTLWNARPRLLFTGDLIESDKTRLDVDFGFGDYVAAQFLGRAIDCRIDSLAIRMENGRETVRAGLRGEISLQTGVPL